MGHPVHVYNIPCDYSHYYKVPILEICRCTKMSFCAINWSENNLVCHKITLGGYVPLQHSIYDIIGGPEKIKKSNFNMYRAFSHTRSITEVYAKN